VITHRTTYWLTAAVVVLLFAGSYAAQSRLESHKSAGDAPFPPQRIVSLAPSITEILFALGLGDRVVGVTRYCRYPAEAIDKPRVGGYFDPNYEAIVALHPHLVVTLTGKAENGPAFQKRGLPTLAVCHQNIEGILDSLLQIGRACGVTPAAESMAAGLKARIDRVQARTAGRPRPRVLFAVDRARGAGRLDDVYIAGSDGHVDRMIAMAGGQNAYRGRVRFPIISAEGILGLNPEVIVDMAARLAADPLDAPAALNDWKPLARVDAVAHGRVYRLDEDFISVPGPRFILVVEKLARLIHPEVDWNGSGR